MADIIFTGENFTSPIVYSFAYIQWEANEIISSELIRNLSLTFAAIAIVTFLFIPNIQMVAMTLACVAFTVTNVAGYIYFMGLKIEFVTSIQLILAVGLAVDYCAHISVTYIGIQKGTRTQRAAKTLKEMGAAVFNGGFSTFLAFVMVSTSKSYVFLTFFKVNHATSRHNPNRA